MYMIYAEIMQTSVAADRPHEPLLQPSEYLVVKKVRFWANK